MAPKVKGKVHWTQKRGNRARVLAIMRKAARARKRMAKAHRGKPRMAKVIATRSAVAPRREVAIPTDSILAPLVRKGSEGVCISCRKPIREHYGHRGVWVGCRAPEVPATATFLLVPVILPADRPMTSGVRAGGRPRALAAEMSTVTATPTERGRTRTNNVVRSVERAAPRSQVQQTKLLPRYVYAARDKRRNLVGASAAVADAYRGLLRASSPVNAIQAAKLAKRPTEANRRCLNLLVEQGLAVKTAIEP